MDASVLWWALVALLMAVGLAGTVLPALPGTADEPDADGPPDAVPAGADGVASRCIVDDGACLPKLLPPPSRLASEMEGAVAATRATTTAPMSQFFIA